MSLMRRRSAELLKRAANTSDIHTLTVAISRLEQAKSSPLLIASMKDLLGRIVTALKPEAIEKASPKGDL